MIISYHFGVPFPGQRILSPRQDPGSDPGSRAARRGLRGVQPAFFWLFGCAAKKTRVGMRAINYLFWPAAENADSR